MKELTVLSLFDGMSCGQLALNRAGIKVGKYYASELDKWAMKVTNANFPDTIQLGDVTKVNTSTLPQVDLLIGGSPCQSFSIAGDGSGFDGSSKLFFEYVRILKELKAANPNLLFLLENVKMKKEWEDVITEHMGVEPIEINSRLVSGQNRPRLYWTNIPNVTQPKDKGILLKDVLLPLDKVEDKFFLSDKAKAYMLRNRNEKPRWTFHKNSLFSKAACLTANMYKGVPYGTVWEQKRRLTPLECERLQTVPEGYTDHVSNTQRYKMLGNGWTVDVIAHIFKNIA